MPAVSDAAPYVDAAERILSGRFDIFSLRDAQLGFPPNWNRDPRTGTEAPLQFGKTLNYRSEALVGDIKYLWEPSRHLELVTLAQAFALSGDARYAQGARTLLSSWFEQCPYPRGPHWTSSLEHAVRLVNWSYAWHLLGGDGAQIFQGEDGARFKRAWQECIYRHLHFVHGHFSRHSSANNHLLGEYMGLFIGAVTWPLWPECVRWRKLARAGFEREALKQNCADGVNREQAIWYHHEVADMMLHCALVGRANGIEFGADYWERLAAMLEYVASVMDVAGHMPMSGDSDDAVMVRFSQEPDFDVYRSLLATGAVLFGRADFKFKAGRFDAKTRWLLGDAAEHDFDALATAEVRLPVRQAFPEGGCWVLGDRFETADEVRLVADAGPLGYLSIAAHGHADALAFTLSVYGREILVDPGTYAYHTQKQWRDYFRSTAAHNTLRVDGEDQSVIGGNFLWRHHARAQCELFLVGAEQDEWRGSHDGYRRLSEPVRHRRGIVLDKFAAEIRVEDVLEGAGRHRVELFWHFAEGCVVEGAGGEWQVRNGQVRVSFSPPEGLEVRAVRGQESPPLGWISRRFDEKQAITTLVCTGHVSAGSSLVTLIRYGRA
ncbi:MAG TPA: alginate lyase family protein [Gammaproteobacteria bacterium]